MQIIFWHSDNAPKNTNVVGRILTKGTFLPTIITGPDEETVEQRANAFWEKEIERRRPASAKKRAGKPDAPAQVTDTFSDMFG